MAKTYQTLKIEDKTYKKFKQIKSLLQFQKNKEYSMSEFLDYLLDLLKPIRLPNQEIDPKSV